MDQYDHNVMAAQLVALQAEMAQLVMQQQELQRSGSPGKDGRLGSPQQPNVQQMQHIQQLHLMSASGPGLANSSANLKANLLMTGTGMPGVNAAMSRTALAFPARPSTAPSAANYGTCLSCDAPIINAHRYLLNPGHTLGGGFSLYTPTQRQGPPLRSGGGAPLPGIDQSGETMDADRYIHGADGRPYLKDKAKAKGTK